MVSRRSPQTETFARGGFGPHAAVAEAIPETAS